MSLKTAPSIGPSLPRLRALVVDDEHVIRRLLRRALARAGFEVVEATDGEAALGAFRGGEFDLVVSDLKMPVMGGLELLRCLKLERPEVPVVLVSGHFEPRAGQSPDDMGAFAVLGKPFSIEEIQRTALRATDTHARQPPRRGDAWC